MMRGPANLAARCFLLVGLLLFGLVAGAQGVSGEISVADLPPEGRHTLSLIRSGGPFPYSQDGAVFGNFEKRLPLHPRGYYREYTVKTPRLSHRGARRIVAGGGSQRDRRTSAEYYYTDDHYDSFRRIRE